MKDHPEEKRGRRWLAALLLLNLLLTALERTLPVWPYRSGFEMTITPNSEAEGACNNGKNDT